MIDGWNVVFGGRKLVRPLPAEYEKENSRVQGIDEQECIAKGNVIGKYGLVSLEISLGR